MEALLVQYLLDASPLIAVLFVGYLHLRHERFCKEDRAEQKVSIEKLHSRISDIRDNDLKPIAADVGSNKTEIAAMGAQFREWKDTQDKVITAAAREAVAESISKMGKKS